MTAVNALTPAGKTPLTEAVSQAAKVLDFRVQPGLIVVLTDGEETCGGSPCNLGEQQIALEAKCLAERNGGLYLPVETRTS